MRMLMEVVLIGRVLGMNMLNEQHIAMRHWGKVLKLFRPIWRERTVISGNASA
jgi:hypothetical protein